MNGWGAVLAALLPSVGVGLIFWYGMRAIINADRSERQALARMDADEFRTDVKEP
ncbi:hypothetical protein [Cellulomonas dongxiuzhuiae]|uniref:Lysyl-tRNA synthetase n=1 Tax=Cellulomonas dongxiuzhuiae TaxID=2819979 RepID=A0ABX8GKM8_9CELL|nr:hypothetical protein [Cellulomonas dongxiuzhuiae]MBO3088694.1 hypothetical protein [Cellulomonas dongxiuzhuiae]MBO3096252.1 hypothetical protein [Cellulomonas dongxiuzhuiae]QWC16674.1 hypothetical protein KKR89_03210 [Cellulomonas dongxiuzhuiae]